MSAHIHRWSSTEQRQELELGREGYFLLLTTMGGWWTTPMMAGETAERWPGIAAIFNGPRLAGPWGFALSQLGPSAALPSFT